jgi:U3 small nucleolar RNA-associated protein 14
LSLKKKTKKLLCLNCQNYQIYENYFNNIIYLNCFQIKNSQPENINLSLPGWGSWSGPNIKSDKKNRKRKQTIIFNVPEKVPRKDENKGKVIIFEDVNEKLKEHLVSELPYPFTSVKDFEASLRAPISSTFVPPNAHLRLTRPAVKTKIGQIIEPMNEDILVKKESTLEKTQRGNNKKNKNNKRFAAKNDKKKHK